MAQGKEYTNFIIKNKEKIQELVSEISPAFVEYIEAASDSEFIMLYKYITHSDLPVGKATRKGSLKSNILYYTSFDEMKKMEKETKIKFQTAHQTCIGLKDEFYDLCGLTHPRENDIYLVNDTAPVYLVNENLEYFCSKFTKQILDKLDKKARGWKYDELDIKLNQDDWITPVQVSCAVHGLGTAKDIEFHKLRHHIFKGDTFIIVFEKNRKQNKFFILLEKNPAFYTILGIKNLAYQKYMELMRKRIIQNVQNHDNAVTNVEEKEVDEITRKEQAKWRSMLANEMMGFTQVEGQVFCPFTYITADFNDLGTLFRASHIKGFKDPNTTKEEKFDINNGLLLCANADALFDKHLITVTENKQLKFSSLLNADVILKQKLGLLQDIFPLILNDERMKYLEYHRAEFERLEIERQGTSEK